MSDAEQVPDSLARQLVDMANKLQRIRAIIHEIKTNMRDRDDTAIDDIEEILAGR